MTLKKGDPVIATIGGVSLRGIVIGPSRSNGNWIIRASKNHILIVPIENILKIEKEKK